jgi:putative redox protein
MNTVELHWHNELTFVGTDQKGHSVVIDGDKVVGHSPIELLLHALASCAAVDVVEIVRKQRATLHRLSVRVEGERRNSHPRRLTAVYLTWNFQVENLTQEKAERAVSLALEKYCSVRSSLDPDIPITNTIEITPPLVS